MIRLLIGLGLCGTVVFSQIQCLVAADEPAGKELGTQTSGSTETPLTVVGANPIELTDEVRDALRPLFAAIAQGEVSRATVELSAESRMDGAVLERQASSFQIASIAPDHFTIYLKEAEQRTRVYCDGQTMIAALASDAYLKLPVAIGNQEAVTSLPVPLGPYPEMVLALTLAGVDPAISLLGGMKSVEIVDREPFQDNTPAVHVRGVQSDLVTWDLWIGTDAPPRPLRLAVDLTPMLAASDQVQIPTGFTYQLRFDFPSWRVSGEVDKSLFRYIPPANAKEYESLDAYYQSIAGVMADHPLLGQAAPEFEGQSLSGEPIGSKAFQGKVAVLDFWATWCAPCVASLPVMKKVTDEYADKGVLFYALNTGEDGAEVTQFLKERELELSVILDPDGTIASTYHADAIPLTLVIGRDGFIESAHIGFVGEDALRQRLKDELGVLVAGGKIATASQNADASSGKP